MAIPSLDIDIWETEETIEPGLFAHDGKKATRYHAKCRLYFCPHIRTAEISSWSEKYREIWINNHKRVHAALQPPTPSTGAPDGLA